MEKKEIGYTRILKSSSIIGFTNILQILFSVVRTKIAALLLGLPGIGILGLYGSMNDLIRNLTSLGINVSSVKDIAFANSTKDDHKIGRIAVIVQRWALATGLLGCIVMIIVSPLLSRYSFNDGKHIFIIILLSINLIFTSLYQSKNAYLQGMQKIKLMSFAGISCAVINTIVSIPIYYFFSINGIVISIIIMSVLNYIVYLYYSRTISVRKKDLTIRETFFDGLSMAKFGIFIVANSFISTGLMYFVKSYINSKFGLDSVGLYQAAWTITNTYVGIMLNAMLADYYPRISANKDNIEINKLVNQQGVITLLLGGPLLFIMLIFAKYVLIILYSSKFIGATLLLQWHISACFFTLIGWTIGVIFLGKGKGFISFVTVLFPSIIYIIIVFLGWKSLELQVLGVAYFIDCFIGTLMTYFLARNLTGYKMSKDVKKILGIYFLLLLIYYFDNTYLSAALCNILNWIILVISITYSFIFLNKLLDIKKIILEKIFKKLH